MTTLEAHGGRTARLEDRRARLEPDGGHSSVQPQSFWRRLITNDWLAASWAHSARRGYSGTGSWRSLLELKDTGLGTFMGQLHFGSGGHADEPVAPRKRENLAA